MGAAGPGLYPGRNGGEWRRDETPQGSGRLPAGSIADIPVLHGWRAVSILLVLASHWVPLPKTLQMNYAAGAAGMALFFCLSGFLIASFLEAGEPVARFLAKRMARVVPLAWLAVSVLVVAQPCDVSTIARNYLFLANIPPVALLHGGEHLWSLGVEMQFYLLAAGLCWAFGRRVGLGALPALGLAVTIWRMAAHQPISIVTWHRIDEIFAGCTLALIFRRRLGDSRWLARVPTWAAAMALFATSTPLFEPAEYFRPYAAALLVGSTLHGAPAPLHRVLTARPMLFLARISYAVYIIHGMLTATWLGSEPGKYLKRPVLAAATVLLAWLSTSRLERPLMRLVRRTPAPLVPGTRADRT